MSNIEKTKQVAIESMDIKKGSSPIKMKPMGFFNHLFCYITLGLLCGWYYFLLFLFPVLIYYSICLNWIAILISFIFVIISIIPLKHEPWEAFMYSWLFKVWREYFDFTYDCDSCNSLLTDDKERYIFFEFPHGVFPSKIAMYIYLILCAVPYNIKNDFYFLLFFVYELKSFILFISYRIHNLLASSY